MKGIFGLNAFTGRTEVPRESWTQRLRLSKESQMSVRCPFLMHWGGHRGSVIRIFPRRDILPNYLADDLQDKVALRWEIIIRDHALSGWEAASSRRMVDSSVLQLERRLLCCCSVDRWRNAFDRRSFGPTGTGLQRRTSDQHVGSTAGNIWHRRSTSQYTATLNRDIITIIILLNKLNAEWIHNPYGPGCTILTALPSEHRLLSCHVGCS